MRSECLTLIDHRKFLEMNDETSFNQLTLKQKYKVILSKGEFIASRMHGGYNIHLFIVEGKFIEIWRSLGLNYIHWIEIVKSDNTLENYVKDIDLSNL